MSAEVRPFAAVAYCADCNEGHGPVEESEADEWAEQHNTEYHNPEGATP